MIQDEAPSVRAPWRTRGVAQSPRVAITVDLGPKGVMHVDIADTRPGGLVPGEESPETVLVLRVVNHGQEIEMCVPVEAVRAAFARRRIGL